MIKYFSHSSRRIILFNTFTMLIFYVVFNVFFLFLLNRHLEKEIDNGLIHEIDHFHIALGVENDSIYFKNKEELQERGLREITEKPYFLRILNKSGHVLFQSPNLKYLSDIPIHLPINIDTLTFVNHSVEHYSLRTCYAPIKKDNKVYGYIQLSTLKSAGKKVFTDILFFDILTFPLVLLVILGISFMNAHQYLAPIRKIIQITKHISATDLSKRIDYEADPSDEIGQLRDTLNHLFDRLENQIKQIAQFTDNAAHQLLSPLTVMKTELELLTRREHTNPDCVNSFNVLIQQTDRMIRIINTLLIISRNDNIQSVPLSIISLKKVIQFIKNHYTQRVTFKIQRGNFFLKGNPEYFLMALQNLIDNALKYSDENSEVIVKIFKVGSILKIQVIDQGIGIPDEEKERIFERFYRSDKANHQKGFGLGLSLVQSVVKQIDGSIQVRDNQPRGTIFELSFPLLKLE
ncbi:sensor histidine kinase [Caldithrix abyssi]|uniref:histidine kinase n=1 Tax=Caldithrix abyssi DSM 13497 TaxID=880073 RepID=H1XQE2_CALAY|nr:ATP-binding protein [Caldithrix abyssi]APF19938.1 His Kinase A (phospho-acceptor) domain-containing protein [Caldithrix abyssi DSM 13497]EHO40029.1 integral membrane sensor signal transduction histidine kinase [Caldithrix abyssi DSM 13497]